MRSKEEAHDYRYFPDPDLLPLEIEQVLIDQIMADLPELPDAKKARFVSDYGVTEYDASVLVADIADSRYFEEIANLSNGKQAANWVINEIMGRANKAGVSISEIATPSVNVAILSMVASNEISGKIAKDVLDIHIQTGEDPDAIVKARGMRQVTDTSAIEAAVDEVLKANPEKVEQAKAKPSMAGWFVGQVMKATQGKANPQAVQALVRTKLGIE